MGAVERLDINKEKSTRIDDVTFFETNPSLSALNDRWQANLADCSALIMH